ncbi:rod shape-determining protein [Bowmanella sp. Y26]|nr:rod shape-determining protein [Bowmanella yangjiangensis]
MELSENKVSIKVFSSDVQYEDEPLIAIEKGANGEVIKAIGIAVKRLQTNNTSVHNPFKHPRSLVADFFLAEKILQYGVKQVHQSRIRPAPRIIMHQLEKTEGGLTSIEERVLRELALGAGAREVLVHLGGRINVSTDSFDAVKARSVATK